MPVSISLVIPTYNRADLIPETIIAALSQHVPFSEIIVVDDGSTDNTMAVLAPYDDRIRIIRSENGGVQSARNKGVAAASGNYVTFCDSDDLLGPNFVETVSKWISSYPETEAVYTNLIKFTATSVEPDDFSQAPNNFLEGAKIRGEFFYDIPDLYLRLFKIHPFYITGCTVKKSFFDSIGRFNTRFNRIGAEDSEFTLRVAASGNVVFCKTPLARVRRHPGNDSLDSVYMAVGRAQILEYAAVHHMNVKKYLSELSQEVSRLRLAAGTKAYSDGKFNIASEMFKHDYQRSMGLKFNVKKIIVRLPAPLRKLVWRVTQG